jgi:hypothetical protein
MKWLKDIWEWIQGLFGKKKKKDKKDKLPDATSIANAKIHGLQADPRPWDKSHPMTLDHYGVGKLRIITEALKAWAKPGQDVSAVCVFLIKKGEKVEGWFYDYIRPNQSGVGRHVPERPAHPKPGHGDYATFGPEDDVYILVAGLCRDGRRNVSLRCPVMALDHATARDILDGEIEIEFDDSPMECMKPDFTIEAPVCS